MALRVSEAENDEEKLGERDPAVYNDLADLEDAMFDAVSETSLETQSWMGIVELLLLMMNGALMPRQLERLFRQDFPLPSSISHFSLFLDIFLAFEDK